jgi:membrane-bound inhibitor of C-type lysozyme
MTNYAYHALYSPEQGETMNRRKTTVIFSTAIIAIGAVAAATAASAAETFQTFNCADGTQFVAAFYPSDPKRTHLQIDGKAVALAKRLALSGSRYSGGGITLKIAKTGTTLKLGKRPVTTCSAQ